MSKSNPVVSFTFTELCRRYQVGDDFVVELISYGVLEPTGAVQEEWRFSIEQARRVQVARRLQRDLGVNLPGIALALDLLEELERMRRVTR